MTRGQLSIQRSCSRWASCFSTCFKNCESQAQFIVLSHFVGRVNFEYLLVGSQLVCYSYYLYSRCRLFQRPWINWWFSLSFFSFRFGWTRNSLQNNSGRVEMDRQDIDRVCLYTVVGCFRLWSTEDIRVEESKYEPKRACTRVGIPDVQIDRGFVWNEYKRETEYFRTHQRGEERASS